MHSKHTTTPLQALYQIFVLPALSTPPKRQLIHPRRAILPKQPHHTTLRPFSSTPSHCSKTRAPEQRTQKWDSEITAPLIYLVPSTTNRLIDPETGEHVPPVSKYSTLINMDTKTHRLVQLSPDPDRPDPNFIPTCKIISKKEVYESEKKRKLQQKEQKRTQKIVTEAGMKTIEMNWAIAEGDLSHRLGRLQEWLREGRRVEVVLAAKKRGRKASVEECENVLSRVRQAVDEVEGAKEREAWHGKMGGFMTVTFQGKPVKTSSGGQATAKEVEEDADEDEKSREPS